jgi:hypothetical protein
MDLDKARLELAKAQAELNGIREQMSMLRKAEKDSKSWVEHCQARVDLLSSAAAMAAEAAWQALPLPVWKQNPLNLNKELRIVDVRAGTFYLRDRSGHSSKLYGVRHGTPKHWDIYSWTPGGQGLIDPMPTMQAWRDYCAAKKG